MSTDKENRCIYLGMPGYGKQTAAAGRALWRASANMDQVHVQYESGSLLACNFNKLWCTALNLVHQGKRLDYFAMLHDDIGADDFWLDALIDEMEAKQLDILGVVVPIKDTRGMTSIAVHHEGDDWAPECRLTMRDVFQLPETFTSDDLDGQKILLNTGCWVCKWDQEWARQVHFEINDRIVFDKVLNCYRPQNESEDWYFSRLLHEIGLKVGATRKISVKHQGEIEFLNNHAWGSEVYDHESPQRGRQTSPVPNAFPAEIPGWLTEVEAKALADISTGKRVLEIGSYCGRSTVCIGRTADHVTAVDYFDGRGTPQPANTKPTFDNSIFRYGLTDKVVAVHPDSKLPFDAYDVAFIDGDHDYESVRIDIGKVLNVLKPGGVIAFHDFDHPSHRGVREAVEEMLLVKGGEILSIQDSLAVVKPSAAIPLEV
jgi:SAM-dependent methyltransferase